MSETSGGGFGGESAGVLYIDVQARMDSLESSMRQMEQRTEAAAETSGGGIRDKIGGAIGALPGLAVAAGAAIGAAIAAGLKTAFDMAQQAQQGVRDFQASLGASKEEAEALGVVAQKVFADNWTGSLKEAQKAVANVRKEVQGLNDTDLQAVTEGSVAIADRFEEDQSKIAAAVQSLMQATGMKAQQAMDFISAGFQKGLNSSGDFLDTLQEYGPIFEKSKIQGGELFSLLETGAAKGALGTDKVADAFKEFGLRAADGAKATQGAYAQLGLDYDKLTKQLGEGKISYTQLFEMVTTKLKGVQSQADRTNIATALFGGAGEDLGSKLPQLDLTRKKIEDLKGSTDTVKNATNTLGSVFETAWRQVQLALLPVGQEILKLAQDELPHVEQAIKDLQPIVIAAVRLMVEGFRNVDVVATALRDTFVAVGLALIVVRREAIATAAAQTWSGLVTATTTVGGLTGAVKALQTALGGIPGILVTLTAAFALWAGNAIREISRVQSAASDSEVQTSNTLLEKVNQLRAAGDAYSLAAAKYLLALDRLQQAQKGVGTVGVLGDITYKVDPAAVAAAEKNLEAAKIQMETARKTRVNTPNGTLGQLSSIVEGLRISSFHMTQGFGTNAGKHGYGAQGHRGVDYGTPVGTAIYAPIAGKVTGGIGWNDGYGNMLKVIDAQGRQLILGHLSNISQSLIDQIKKNGSAYVGSGTFLGKTGNTGNSTGPHLHIEVRDARGVVRNPLTFGLGDITQQPKTPKPTPITVPIKPAATAKEIQAELDAKLKGVQARLSLGEISTTQAQKAIQGLANEARQKGRAATGEMKVAYADAVKAALSALKSLDKGQTETRDRLADLSREFGYRGTAGLKDYISGLKAFVAQQEKVVASTKEGTKAHADAMNNVIQGREKLAAVQKTAALGLTSQDVDTYRARAEEVIKLEKGLSTSTDLEWKRRAQNRIESYKTLPPAAQKVLELLKGQDDQQVESAKKRQAALDSVNRAVAEGHIQAARRSLDEAARLQAEEVNNNRLSADQRVAAYQASTGKVLSAAYALHAEEKRQANAAVDAWAKSEEGKALTTQQRDAEVTRRKAANREAERQANLASQREQAKLYQGLTDTQITEGERAAEAVHKQAQDIASTRYKMTADLVRYSYGQGEDGLYTALSSVTGYSIDQVKGDVDKALAEAQRLNSSLTNTIKEAYAEPLKAHADAVAVASAENARAVEMAGTERDQIVQANQEAAKSWGWLLDPLHQKAEETGEVVDDTQAIFGHFVGQAKELLGQGINPQQSGFIQYLEEFAKGSDAAAVAAQRLLNMRDKFLATGDTVTMDSPVAALPIRAPKPVTPAVPDRGVAALPAHAPKPSSFAPTPEQARGEQQAINRLNEWNTMLESKRLDDYKASLGKMSDAQLKEALTKAEASKNTLRYTLLLEEQKRRQEGATHALEDSINKWGNYAKQIIPVVAGAFAALGGVSGDTADQWASDLGNMTSDLVNFGTAIAKGDYVGAAVQALTTIFNWFGRNKKAAQEAAKATADYNKQFTFSANGYGTREVTKTSTGILFWKTDHYNEKVDEVGKALATSLESGFKNGVENGLLAAVQQNDFSQFQKTLTDSVGQAVLKGLIDAFMQEEILKGIIGPRIEAVIKARKTAGKEDDLAAMSGLKTAVGEATSAAQGYYNDILKPIASSFGLLGSGTGGSGASGSLFGNAPTVQLGIPRIEVSLPDASLKPLADLASAIPTFDAASRRLMDAATMMLTKGGDPPRLTGNGGLAGV